MSHMRDGGGIAGPAARPDFLGKALSDGLIVVGFRIELPTEDVVLLDHHAATIPVDADRLGQSRINTGGRLDHSQGAIGKSQAGDSGILDLDALMRQSAREAGHPTYRSHHPRE